MRRTAIALGCVLAACSAKHGAGTGDAGGSDGGTRSDGGGADGGIVTVSGITPTFTFESGPVRPLALSPDGSRLFAANTSNGSLDVLAIGSDGSLTLTGSTYVGVDPVAVAARSNTEVWVVNQISDTVSVVDVSASPPHVVRTLLVGDNPSDLVFAGSGATRAFITTAHRGQQRTDPSIAGVTGAGDPQFTTAGVSRADVWVFDATNLGTTVGGTPLQIVTLFGDTPRALAVTPDGNTVYAAIFKSGDQTTSTSSELPCPGFDGSGSATTCMSADGSFMVPGAPPGPGSNYAGIRAPAVSVMLQMDGSGAWRDHFGRDWSVATEFTLPDQDVFAIDANTLATTTSYQHVGTTLFAMAVNPITGKLYVSNTQARNDLRFEGSGVTSGGEFVNGHLAESDITVIDGSNATVTPHHLNKHIDYTQLPAPAGTAAHSLATPLNMVVTPDGSKLYVSAFGSSKIGVFSTSELEADTFDPTTESGNYIAVSGGGPSGIVLDSARGKLYVATRFDDGVSTIDVAGATESSHLVLNNPEPAAVTMGRRFLYDATISSSNGEAACASCHIFGDKDDLAWDLGNPDIDPTDVPNNITIRLGVGAPGTINGTGRVNQLHPMKGPMTTQTMRGLVNHGPGHWRGDRVSGVVGTDTSLGPPFNSSLAFENFLAAFNSLLGLGPTFSLEDMETFTAFAMDIAMPPNPVRALDNSLNASQAAGRAYFLGCTGTDSITGQPVVCDANGVPQNGGGGHFADGVPSAGLGFTCTGCHVLNPAMGFFGTDGNSSFEALPQVAKIPQLRNLYDKIGMFGVPAISGSIAGNNGFTGNEVRGIGFEHDGSVDTLFRFLNANVFDPGGNVGFAAGSAGDTQRRDVEQYLLAFDNDLAPVVGQQVTLRSDNATAAGPRIDLFIARATTPFASKILGPSAHECDLVGRLVRSGAAVTYRMQADQSFVPNDSSPTLTDSALRALAATTGQEITYTCLPPGWAG